MRIENQDVIRIGAGEFSTAWRVVDSDIVYILSRTDDENNQYVKDIYVHSSGKHIPEYETVELERYIPRVGYRNVFKTRYYHKLTASNKEAWNQAIILRNTLDRVKRENNAWRNPDNAYTLLYDVIAMLRKESSVPESLIEALDRLYSWATAYGSNFYIEFQTRNLKVDNNGDLILLDVIFFERSRSRY